MIHPAATTDRFPIRQHGGPKSFVLSVDSGTSIGNAVQVPVSHDLTGNGSWDRLETYRYFATDPVPGAERYTQKAGLVSATGLLGDLFGGRVQVEIWVAVPGGSHPATVAANSSLSLPFS